jgi:DNA-binding beta-propeller fold protein YncE
LFTTSAVAGFLDVINFSDPTNPTVITSIDMNVYGGVTSVAVKNGIVAVASPNTDETLNGSVVFFDTNGTFLKQVTVGALPDMIVFSPDGTKVMTANEGQPNTTYTIDPEGSVSTIDISDGIASLSQANVTTINFTSFNTQEAALLSSGVRKVKTTSTLSQDFEPEYITISADSQKAYVALQENNAIAEINLTNNTITDIWALGTKDISIPGNGFDISDNNGQVLIANWPIKAFYIPDAISNYTVAGTNYIITANEGDEKEYGSFTERTTVGAATYTLDPVVFPNASILKQNHNMGRFRTTNVNGNTDADVDYEVINCVGARSFSIFNATTKQIVFDSSDDFERYTAANFPTIFNSDHESNSVKNRSRAKGPEPEGITVAKIGTETFAFITLERIGGVMVYNITNPNNVSFVDYKNSRSTSAFAGDHGPEGITYIAPENSPNGTPYVLVANEISGTITIFEVDTNALTTPDFGNRVKTFALFPNPSNQDGIVYFNRTADIEVFDLTGKVVLTQKEAQTINTKSLATGTYLVRTNEGIVKKLIVK